MIDWNTVITTILASSAITTIVLTVVGFVSKSIFTQLLSRDIERFKANRETELERFKSDLQRSSFEHQTRYQNLHVKRAEIIAELYSVLVQAEHDAISLTYPDQGNSEPSQAEKIKGALKSAKILYDCFEKNRIYFKPESCEKIADFIQGLSESLVEFNNQVLAHHTHQDDQKEKIEKWGEIWAKLTTELSSIKNEIEHEFREILGL